MTTIGQFDYRELDEVIHVRSRLGIVAALNVTAEAEFTQLKQVLGLTDGALGTHLRKLEEVGYVSFEKDFVGRKPRTRCRLTPKGKAAFQAYLARMAELLATTPNAPTPATAPARVDVKENRRRKRSTLQPLAVPG